MCKKIFFILIIVFSSKTFYVQDKWSKVKLGFAFLDVLALGFTFKIDKITFDIRPNFRHVSNVGLQSSNSG